MQVMSPEDLYQLTGAINPRLSPDGRSIVYVVWKLDEKANCLKSALWLTSFDGSASPRQFTLGESADGDPAWSPNGAMIAFTSKRGGAAAQLHVIPVDGGEARRLTDLKEDVEDPAWSPDSAHIVFSSRVRSADYDETDDKRRAPRRIMRLQYKLDNEGWTIDRPHHLFVARADGSNPPVQITFGDFEDAEPAWSPDGSRIVFASARHQDWDITPVRDLYAVSASGGEPEALTGGDGSCAYPAWSPDGAKIAYQFYPAVFDDPRHTQIAVLDLATRRRRILTTALDRNCGPYPPMRSPVWDGPDALVFAVEDRGNVHLYRVLADGSAPPELVQGGDLTVNGYDVAAGRMVHTHSKPAVLSELYAGDRRLTAVGRAFTETRRLGTPERFTAVSRDGTEVEAWMLRPAGFQQGRKYAALLNIHGGPFTQYGNKFFDEFHIYSGAGYAVIYSNPRGSSGYSEAWGRAIRGPVEGGPGWGSVDYEDLMAVVDESIRRFNFIDPERLAVMGGSYGGFMTSWILGRTTRFRTAISERAVNNLIAEGGSSDIGIFWKGYVGAHMWEAPEAYRAMSPSTYAANITTPLLILHSEEDLRCPVGQGEDLFLILRALRREVEFVRFPAEGHELSRSGSPIHRVMRFRIILDWLARYLS